MLQWLAPAFAGLLGVVEVARRYEARIAFYRSVWKSLALLLVINAVAAASVVAILDANTKLGGGAVLLIAGLGGPTVLRARLIDWEKRAIRVQHDDSLTRQQTSHAFGPAALYEWLLDRLDQVLWSELLNWHRAYVDAVLPKLIKRGHDVASVVADLESYVAGLQFDQERKKAVLDVIKMRATEPEAMRACVRVAIERLPGAFRRIDWLTEHAPPP